MPVTYFDPSYLKSYLQTGIKLAAFVDGSYLTINLDDLNDLVDTKKGVGYIEGKPVEFDYRDIDHLKVGSLTFSKDLLNKDQDIAKKGEEDSEDSKSDDNTSSDTRSIDSDSIDS